MKRCPNCEFIYEDDQSHCDMDGTKLALDSRPLPKLQALTVTNVGSDSRWRSRAVPVFASAMLAIVLGFVYYVSTRQVATTATAVTDSSPIEAHIPAAPSPEPTVSEATSLTTDAPTQTDAKSATPIGVDAKKSVETRTNANAERNIKPAQQTRGQKRVAKEPAEKDDSKVRSILKKTGRFFKKALPR